MQFFEPLKVQLSLVILSCYMSFHCFCLLLWWFYEITANGFTALRPGLAISMINVQVLVDVKLLLPTLARRSTLTLYQELQF